MLCQHFMALWVTTDESDTLSSPVGPPHIAASLLTDGSWFNFPQGIASNLTSDRRTASF